MESVSSESLNDYIANYKELDAIEKEKADLNAQANAPRPKDLPDRVDTLIKLQEVYRQTVPALVKKEWTTREEAIHKWSDLNKGSEAIAAKAINQLEINALRDLLALKIKANEVSQDLFETVLPALEESVNSKVAQLKALPEEQRGEAAQAVQTELSRLEAAAKAVEASLKKYPPQKNGAVLEAWRKEYASYPQELDSAYASYKKIYAKEPERQ